MLDGYLYAVGGQVFNAFFLNWFAPYAEPIAPYTQLWRSFLWCQRWVKGVIGLSNLYEFDVTPIFYETNPWSTTVPVHFLHSEPFWFVQLYFLDYISRLYLCYTSIGPRMKYGHARHILFCPYSPLPSPLFQSQVGHSDQTGSFSLVPKSELHASWRHEKVSWQWG